jgi:hypothetical protein
VGFVAMWHGRMPVFETWKSRGTCEKEIGFYLTFSELKISRTRQTDLSSCGSSDLFFQGRLCSTLPIFTCISTNFNRCRFNTHVKMMGRMIRPYRLALNVEIVKWKPFKDALQEPEKRIFENMLLRSKLYTSAGSMATQPIALEIMFMSILLDHHIRLFDLATQIEKIRLAKVAKEPKGIEKFLQSPH